MGREGERVSWLTVNGLRTGIIVDVVMRKKDGGMMGYMIRLNNGKHVIVHPNSFTNGSKTQK